MYNMTEGKSDFYALKLQAILPCASAHLPMWFELNVTALETFGVTDVISAPQHCPYSCSRDKILSLCVKVLCTRHHSSADAGYCNPCKPFVYRHEEDKRGCHTKV